jgi:DNA primase
MQDTNKYLIHATITADGVVERSDVVGAVFGQTEGLLGDELDLRELQETSKIGRIDVEIDSQQGQSVGEITIATSLDKAETATLAAALETITRVGPCRSTVEVTDLEDLRAAKRRQIVDRAQELLIEAFDDSMMSSDELVEAVRERVRVESITEYEELPAGPRVEDSDAIVIVEGRSDVVALLKAGIKNAIAVEGTDVPDAVARLTQNRRTTAFLDGDRGGDLILKELAQVGDVDYVAFAPEGRSVEDLSRHQVLAALRGKIDHSAVAGQSTPHEIAASDPARTSGGTVVENPLTDLEYASPAASGDDATDRDESTSSTQAEHGTSAQGPASETPYADPQTTPPPSSQTEDDGTDPSVPESRSDESAASIQGDTADAAPVDDASASLRDQIETVLGTGTVRLLDDDGAVLAEDDVANAADLLEDCPADAAVVLLDETLDQGLLDVAAQRDLERIVAAELGSFTKRPTNVRIHEAATILEVD